MPGQSEGSQESLPLFSADDSYQGPPAADFDNSRAGGVAAFKTGLGLDGSLTGKRSAGQSDAASAAACIADSKQQGSLWSAWTDAAKASGGEKPVDFGFLMGGPPASLGEDCAPASPVSKRGRVAMEFDDGDNRQGFCLPSIGATARGGYSSPVAASNDPGVSDADSSPALSVGVGFTSGGSAPSRKKQLAPPRPEKKPKKVFFGRVPEEDRGPNPMDPAVVRTDVFAWLRDDGHQDPEVQALLEEENAYADGMQEHLGPLRNTLYKEMLGHQKEADASLLTPYPGGYGYFTRTYVGKPYQAHYRRRCLDDNVVKRHTADDDMGARCDKSDDEELVLDENELAVDPIDGTQKPYCSVSGPHASPDHASYVCGVDYNGDDSYTLRLFSLPRTSGEWSPVEIEATDGSAVWAPRGEGFYYVALDHEFRPYKILWHRIGDEPSGSGDCVVLEEPDKRFSVSLSVSSCRRFLVISIDSSETSEAHLLDLQSSGLEHEALAPGAAGVGLLRLAQRSFGHRYAVDHRDGWLYVLTSKDGKRNSKLCRVSVSALPDAPLESWEDVWVPGEATTLDSHHCFRDFMVLQGREKGEPRIFVTGYRDGESNGIPLHCVAFPDAAAHCGHVLTPRGATAARAAFSAGLCSNEIFEAEVIRYNYTSFTLPTATYEYDVKSRAHKLIHRTEVPNFDAGRYRAERIVTPGRGVPISLVYRKDLHPQGLVGGPFPVLLTGYGAYGCCSDPDFDGNRLTLLDRGVIYALAHVRGGGELGRSWYEDGRYTNVKNRFADFVDAADTLVSLRIAEPSRLAAWGTSSGGLLVTASMNLRPDLFCAVLLEVPFVDALNTMSDPSIPLTVGEWEEIGNPNEREYFYYMLEYSPYDNIRMEDYPAALVTASLNDAMVGYWEPLKYVSKLRLLRTNDKPALLRTNFHAGHGAASDRYEGTREAAFHFAFLLEELGLANTPPLH